MGQDGLPLQAVGLIRRYNEWMQKLDQWVTRDMGATWQREFDERMLGRYRRFFGEHTFGIINGKLGLASRLSAEGQYGDALDLFEQVLVQRAERYGPDHHKTREVKLAVAVALKNLDRFEEANGVLAGLVAACSRLLGDTDAETLRARLWQASVLIDLGSYESAHEQLTRIFDATRATDSWWDPQAEARSGEYWSIVTTDEVPD
jgi:thioredoxin-like negative regulator of GroEL